ncbi:TPA: hypothetical protein ACX6RX_003198 [Photobacterium damselae]
MNLSRLSDLNIDDDILRADFYRIIISYINSPTSNLFTYTIKIDEEYRPDLAAYRAFGSEELRWLITLVCGIDDEAMPLPIGDTFSFPPVTWIRQQMRRFIEVNNA